MDAAAFLIVLRKRAAGTSPPQDPLANSRGFLAQYAETAEGRALRRVLQTLATRRGTFTESDAWLFSSESLGIVSALVDARLAGRYREEEWQSTCR